MRCLQASPRYRLSRSPNLVLTNGLHRVQLYARPLVNPRGEVKRSNPQAYASPTQQVCGPAHRAACLCLPRPSNREWAWTCALQARLGASRLAERIVADGAAGTFVSALAHGSELQWRVVFQDQLTMRSEYEPEYWISRLDIIYGITKKRSTAILMLSSMVLSLRPSRSTLAVAIVARGTPEIKVGPRKVAA